MAEISIPTKPNWTFANVPVAPGKQLLPPTMQPILPASPLLQKAPVNFPTGWSQPGMILKSPEQLFMEQQGIRPPGTPSAPITPTAAGVPPQQTVSAAPKTATQKKLEAQLEKENARVQKASAERVARSHKEAIATRQSGTQVTKAKPGMIKSLGGAATLGTLPFMLPSLVAGGGEMLGLVDPQVSQDVGASPIDFLGRAAATAGALYKENAPSWLGGWDEATMQALRTFDPNAKDIIWEGFGQQPTSQRMPPPPPPAPAPTPTPGPMGMFVPSVSGPGGAAPQATGVDYTQLAALLGGEVTPEEAPGKMDFLLNALAQTGYNPNMGMGENLLQLGLASLASGPQARAAERQVGKETAAVQAEQQKQTLDLLMKQLAADAATEQFNIKTQLDFAENQRQAGQNLRPMVAGDGVVLFPQPTAGGTNWIPQQVGTPGGSSKAAQDAQTAKILALYLGSEQLSPMVNELLSSPGMNQLSMMDSTARQVLLQQLQMANPEVYNYAVQQVQGQ